MPTCPWSVRVLALLDEEQVDPACADHLETCPACRQALVEAAGPLPRPPAAPPAPEPPPHLLARLHALARATGGQLPAGFRPEVDGIEVFEELGRGGTGVVFRARQTALDRVVALKVMHPAASVDADAFERAARGVRTLARFGHPGIVQVLQVGRAGGCYFGVIEYVAGGTLAARLDGRPVPPATAARFVMALAEAVQVLHGQGFIHRDIKPSNVLLANTPGPAPHSGAGLDACRPKLADFGLARPVGVDDVTETGMVLGSPGRMAPEQARGSTALGPACDVYALGGILYELLTGRPPFPASSPTEALSREVVGPVGRLPPDVPGELARICERCLDREPARRYPDAGRLAADLATFLDRVAAARRRRRVLAAAAVLAVLLAGATWVGFSLGRGTARPAAAAEVSLYELRLEVARECLARGDRAGAWAQLERCLPEPGRPDLRDDRWHRLWENCQPREP